MVFYIYRDYLVCTFLSLKIVSGFTGKIIPGKEIIEVSTLNIMALHRDK